LRQVHRQRTSPSKAPALAILGPHITVRLGQVGHLQVCGVPFDAAVEALAKSTEAFAAARMNRGIRQALAGKRVEEV